MLENAHEKAPCASCHLGGLFRDTPNQCVDCHGIDAPDNGTLSREKTLITLDHMGVDTQCVACHNTIAWSDIVTVNHQHVRGECADCHNDVIAMDKDAAHINSTDNCDACHLNGQTWRPLHKMDHNEVTGDCVDCHNDGDQFARNSKEDDLSGHILTSNNCEACHEPTAPAWNPVKIPMPHSEIDLSIRDNCQACHDGQTATGKHPGHIPTNSDCDVCHNSTVDWRDVSSTDHTALTVDCGVSCHTPTGIGPYKSGAHPSTSETCELCHAGGVVTPNWKTTCGDNDGGTSGADCMRHSDTVSAALTCDTCHVSGNAWGADLKIATHIPTGTAECESCHTNSGTNFSVWTAWTFNHASDKNGNSCVACHVSTTAALRNKPTAAASHPGSTNTCERCHVENDTIGLAQWSTNCGTTGDTDAGKDCMDHGQASGTVLSNCNSCHSGAHALAMTKADKVGHPITSAECDTCHTPVKYTDWTGAGFDHSSTVSGCNASGCHISGGGRHKNDYSAVTHISSTETCELCHAGGVVTPNWKTTCGDNDGGTSGADCMRHSDTVSAALTCDTCHVSGNAWGADLKIATHIPTGTAECESCHTNSGTNFSVWTAWTFNHASDKNGNSCVACHVSTTAALRNKPTAAASHPGSTNTCERCHVENDTIGLAQWSTNCGSTGDTDAGKD
ncbi:MAG: hypothetical protein H0W44_00005, partial [Gammaproteobacteria bacterium]|nr:hypothetical protein [Gammaproteobacteria bacterium]